MGNLERGTDLIRTRVHADWDEKHLELAALRVESRRRQRRRASIALYTATAVAAVVALYLVGASTLKRREPTASPMVATIASAAQPSLDTGDRALRFSDGSLAVPVDDGSRLSIAEDTPSSMIAELDDGRGQFDVVTDGSRLFGVRAGRVLVIAIGTKFTVGRLPDHVEVSVQHGRVRVEFPGGVRELGAGESGTYDAPDAVDPSDDAPRPSADGTHAVPKSTWQALARQRRFGEAYGLLGTGPVENAKDLMLAADVARLSGHPEEAAGYLQRVVAKYPRDFSAQLAAFSLGRIYLEQLGRPQEAAARFAQARSLAGTGALAQDALAREVEALARAGNGTQARARAQEYLRLFPNGPRAAMVRKLGGLDE